MSSHKHKKFKAKKAGLPPGSLIYSGTKTSSLDPVKISVFDYSADYLNESQIASIDQCSAFCGNKNVSWINFDGVHDISQIQKIGEFFNVHSLVLEDILHTTQRPKIDEHDNYIYIVLKMLGFDQQTHSVNSEQVSFILTRDCIISFLENPGDVFDPVRERIRSSKGRIRKMGADYLVYALIDAIVDHYFVVLEELGEQIQILEDKVIDKPDKDIAQDVHRLKRQIILVRKAVWPLREVVSGLERIESSLLSDSLDPYIRDVYDHTVQVIDTVESYRDIISGMLEIYLANVSNRMNEVMKVLTIISTIFIPLNFVAGVYGMNFKHMPELEWTYGYPFTLTLMLTIAASLLVLFKIKKWI